MQPIFKARDFTDTAQPGLKFTVSALRWSDAGGPVEARITASGTVEELYRLTAMMRCPVDIYDDLGVWLWGGYVSEIQIGSGAYTYGAQIDSMANKIAVAYSYIEPGTNNVGTRKTTAFAQDDTSIAEYGTKEALISESGLSDTAATNKRDTALAEKFKPQGVLTWGASETSAEIVCRGWFDTLSWRLASWASVSGPGFSTNNADQSIGAGTAIMEAMQQITVGDQSINLLSLGIYGRKVGAPTDNLYIGVYALDTSGNPTGSSLASVTLAGTALSTSNGWISGTITEYELAAGTAPAYAVQVSRSGTADASNYYVWRVDTALGYTGGTMRTYGGTTWSALATPADATFQTTVNNKVQSLTQIQDLTTQYGQFIETQVFEFGGTLTPALVSYRDGDTDTLTEIAALMKTGTTNGRRILAAVDKDRRVIWSEEPASTTITHYLKRDGTLTDSSGARVVPYMPPVGVWAQLADVPSTADNSLLIDASRQYISGAEWTADGGLRLEFRGNDSLATFSGGALDLSASMPLIMGKVGTWRHFTTPLTSTSWDGDARSTTAKTLIDLSATFTNADGETVPAGARAIAVRLAARDSASSTTSCFIALAPNATADIFALVCKPYDRANDDYLHVSGVVPCDANGDIYFQCTATGANTLDVILEIWGYLA